MKENNSMIMNEKLTSLKKLSHVSCVDNGANSLLL